MVARTKEYRYGFCMTILIKTFERPKSVKKAVELIKLLYKDIPIIIADDSREPNNQFNHIPLVEYYYIGFDKGLSYGRNFLVDKCKTEYCFIIDDDIEFTEHTDLGKLKDILDKGYDIVVPQIIRNETDDDYSGRIVYEEKDGEKIIKFVREKEDKGDYYEVDIGMNVLFGKTEYFRTNRWDDELKVGEHQEYFIRNRPKVAQAKYVSIRHSPVTNEFYYDFRKRASDYASLAKAKLGINKIIGFDNNEILE